MSGPYHDDAATEISCYHHPATHLSFLTCRHKLIMFLSMSLSELLDCVIVEFNAQISPELRVVLRDLIRVCSAFDVFYNHVVLSGYIVPSSLILLGLPLSCALRNVREWKGSCRCIHELDA